MAAEDALGISPSGLIGVLSKNSVISFELEFY